MEYPSGQSCSISTPKLGHGHKGKGWVLHYCCDTLRRPLVVHTCAQVADAAGTSIWIHISAQA